MINNAHLTFNGVVIDLKDIDGKCRTTLLSHLFDSVNKF